MPFTFAPSRNRERTPGAPEAVERSEESDLGLRVFVGQRQAGVATSISARRPGHGCARAVAMARAAPEDPLRAAGDRRRDLPRARHTRNVRRR